MKKYFSSICCVDYGDRSDDGWLNSARFPSPWATNRADERKRVAKLYEATINFPLFLTGKKSDELNTTQPPALI